MIDSVVAIIGGLIYRTIAMTWRFEGHASDFADEMSLQAILAGKDPASILFAHGQMFPLWYHLRTTGGVPVVSRSRDGERLVRMLRVACRYDRFIRGSSSVGGREVLREMTQTLTNRSILVTPDGPRGPAGYARPGGIVSASRVGRPVCVVFAESDRSFRLSTWDRMMIPLPFSKIYIRYCIMEIKSESEIETAMDHVSALISGAEGAWTEYVSGSVPSEY